MSYFTQEVSTAFQALDLEVVFSHSQPRFTTVELDSLQSESVSSILKISPVRIIGNKVDIDPVLLAKDAWADFDYKGKKYLVHKTKDEAIEIYKVK